jgi:hypothetical protein
MSALPLTFPIGGIAERTTSSPPRPPYEHYLWSERSAMVSSSYRLCPCTSNGIKTAAT